MAQDIEAVGAVGVGARLDGGVGRRIARAWAPWRRRPLGLFGAFLCTVLIVLAFTAPLISPYEPKKFVGKPLETPNSTFWLGTNNLGQDNFSRTLYGAQISIAVGLVATTIGIGIGTIVGVVGGYLGGWVDMLIQRLLEVLGAFPGLFLALIVIAALGRPQDSGTNVIQIAWQLRTLELAIGLAFVFAAGRIIRSAVLTERNMTYITAAQSVGVTQTRILWRHILPNVMPYVIVSFSVVIGVVILVEAGLSFLGYGASIGTPSWGVDLSNTNRQYFVRSPFLIIGPGVALSLTVIGFNFLGDALRDILDPRLRGAE